ncbi:hypothetical protein PYW07_004066 [Mythimna separata]|uniref:Uncharacterized protein n=1 Tax=Mythimna separata TaxID=271217 RepID=A0AAD7YNC1_MYTSE|nr:hypothetical protein PYW07_004066 [Mythimna separata]
MDLNNLPSGSLANINSEEIYDELKNFLGGLGDPHTFFEMFGYAAFNPVELRKKLERKITKDDLLFLIALFLTNKKNDTLRKECRVKLQQVTRKINLKPRANGNSRVVTLLRVAQAFPEIVAMSLKLRPEVARPITLVQMRLHSEYPEFPALALQPLLACLLPKTHKHSLNIMNTFLLSNMLLTETFNQKSHIWSYKSNQQKVQEVKSKQMNHYHSAVLNEDLRKSWCIRLEIMVDTEYSSVWIEAASRSKDKLVQTYGDSF